MYFSFNFGWSGPILAVHCVRLLHAVISLFMILFIYIYNFYSGINLQKDSTSTIRTYNDLLTQV